MSRAEKLRLCVGCREDFYNGKNNLGIKECWNLRSARVVRRWRIHWWTQPIVPGAFTEVKTLSCHSEPGEYAFYEKLPSNAVEPNRLKRSLPPRGVTA